MLECHGGKLLAKLSLVSICESETERMLWWMFFVSISKISYQ